MLRIILVLSLLVTGRFAFSQSISGSWYGKADVVTQGGVYNNYLTELVLKQKGNSVEGVFGYYFKDSYQSFFVRGSYDPNTRQVSIKNLPMLFYQSRNTQTGAECMMDFQGTLRVSQVKSSMSGSFVTIDRYKYTCPQMRASFTMDVATKNLDSMLSSSIVGKRFWMPQREDVVVKSKMPVVNGAPTAIGTASIAPVKITDSAIEAYSERNLVAQFTRRKIIYTKELEIGSDSIRISLYDNGEIDGDTVTVFLNGQPVISHQELTARATNIYLTLDNSKDVNEVSLFAENLGKIPPNTALMVVTDGISRFEVFLSSSYTQNATVRIKKRISRH